jgi:hypothetical protein
VDDERVRSYNSIRNMTVIVSVIAYFTSIYRGMSLNLKVMLQKIFILSKRFFVIPPFFNYAISDVVFFVVISDFKKLCSFSQSALTSNGIILLPAKPSFVIPCTTITNFPVRSDVQK